VIAGPQSRRDHDSASRTARDDSASRTARDDSASRTARDDSASRTARDAVGAGRHASAARLLALASCSAVLVGCGGAAASCGGTRPFDAEGPWLEAPPGARVAAASTFGSASPRAGPNVDAMVARVASARGLPVLRPVASYELDRAAMMARIRAHAERETPREIVIHQGEVLAALELVPLDYDLEAGALRLIEGRVAGYYEPEDQALYVADDLDAPNATETLAHELTHALQDQTYGIGAMLAFKPGEGDRLAAAHALIEGDAVSAMYDVVLGSASRVDMAEFRQLLVDSTEHSSVASVTPSFLKASLNAPYSEGFACVQGLRRRGGWPAVDAVWRALPASTEQILHPDKLAAREPPIVMPLPSIDGLGEGFRAVLDDGMGELDLRLAIEEWLARDSADDSDDVSSSAGAAAAARAAAGWGGDRYLVARRDLPGHPARHELAFAWHLRFDTAADAVQMTEVLTRRFGSACQDRADLGPILWRAAARDVVLVAGPYERRSGDRGARSAGSCAGAATWARGILKAAGVGGPW
jgi:hypothetical protein